MEFITEKEVKKFFISPYYNLKKIREDIDKINVFPVADHDTGTNLFLTFKGIKQAVENKEFSNLKELSKVVLESSFESARGNVGVIFSGFLLGFLPSIKNPVNLEILAEAFLKGAKKARSSIDNPCQGTVLDVIDATADSFVREAEEGKCDISEVFKTAVKQARESLLNTKEKMKIYKKAGFVDAGGLGYLTILESWQKVLKEYEIIALLSNSSLSQQAIKQKLRNAGNSLEVIKYKNEAKIHIHTDSPEEVINLLQKFGRIKKIKKEILKN